VAIDVPMVMFPLSVEWVALQRTTYSGIRRYTGNVFDTEEQMAQLENNIKNIHAKNGFEMRN